MRNLCLASWEDLSSQTVHGEIASVAAALHQEIQDTLQSNIADPAGTSSNLMDVEITSYEVTYSRGDTGTRVPPPLVQPSLLYVPAGGNTDVGNLRILQSPQLTNLPLSDLENFGFDRETGSTVVILNIRLRFFGRTIGGRELETAPRSFTVEFRA